MNQTYDQGSVVERADNDIQWINSYPEVYSVDGVIQPSNNRGQMYNVNQTKFQR